MTKREMTITWIVLLGGMMVGFVLGLVSMVSKTTIGRDTVLECRRLMRGLEELPPEAYDRFWKITNGNPLLKEQWEIREAISRIPIAEKGPETAL